MTTLAGLRIPKQKIREPFTQGGKAFRLTALDPNRQHGRAMDELVELAQQALGNLDGPLVAGRMKSTANFVR